MSRPRRSRVRHVAKWVGLVLTLLVIGVWIGSGVGFANFKIDGPRSAGLGASRGCLVIGWIDVVPGGATGPTTWSRRGPIRSPHFTLDWRPDWEYASHKGGTVALLVLPLWVVTVATALPTAFLWRRDARVPRPGHCPNCGYDLAGLDAPPGSPTPHAPCPECGTASS